MTAIAGFCHEGKVWIGGDSAGIAGWSLIIRADQKVFKNGEFIFGFTSSFRMGQLIQHALTPPKQKEGQDLFAYMVTDFVDAIRNCLKAGGFATKDKEGEAGGTFLVGHKGRLFRIDSDYQVAEAADRYDSCGCGFEIVAGALFATKNMPPPERMQLALSAAERHSAGVRGPFHMVST